MEETLRDILKKYGMGYTKKAPKGDTMKLNTGYEKNSQSQYQKSNLQTKERQ